MNVINVNVYSEKQVDTTYQNTYQIYTLFTQNDTSLSYMRIPSHDILKSDIRYMRNTC